MSTAVLRESASVRATAIASLVVLAIVAVLETRLSGLRYRTITRRTTDEATIPTPSTIRLLSLGHREWAAGLLWTSALAYFGESLSSHSQQRYLQRFADTIEEVDPRFRQAYLWGATISLYNTRVIRRESVERAIAHLERGLRAFPGDGEMTYQIGFDYYVELPRLIESSEERLEVRRRGAEYLRRAAALGHGPPWMALSAADALQEVGLVARALDELRDIYVRTEEPEIRARIERQIADLSGQAAGADPFVAEARRLDRERMTAFPYVSPLLYLFIAPPVPGVAHIAPPVVPSAPGSAQPGAR